MQRAQEVADLVQERLSRKRIRGIKLSVLEDQIRREPNNCWYVPVQPSAEPSKTSEYYEVLADVEVSLSEDANLDVILIPALPEGESVSLKGSRGLPRNAAARKTRVSRSR